MNIDWTEFSTSLYYMNKTNVVEPLFNKGPWDWPNMIRKMRFCYIKVLFHMFYYNWGRKYYHSLYRGLCNLQVGYIEVTLYRVYFACNNVQSNYLTSNLGLTTCEHRVWKCLPSFVLLPLLQCKRKDWSKVKFILFFSCRPWLWNCGIHSSSKYLWRKKVFQEKHAERQANVFNGWVWSLLQ